MSNALQTLGQKKLRQEPIMNDPLVMMRLRFMAKITPDPNGCWMWTGSCDESGYGRFWYTNGPTLAYRAGYQLFIRPLGADEELHHICENPRCVRFDHLLPLSHKEHMNLFSPRNITSRHAIKKYCDNGHSLVDKKNTRTDKYGYRHCRTCERVSARLLLSRETPEKRERRLMRMRDYHKRRRLLKLKYPEPCQVKTV